MGSNRTNMAGGVLQLPWGQKPLDKLASDPPVPLL
jgi:hypothetical protein